MASPSLQLELEREVEDAGCNLLLLASSTRTNELLNTLDQVEGLLTKVEQAPIRSMQNALYPSMKALISNQLLRHSDMYVKVSVASCLSEFTRITAPEAPYNEEQMKEVCQLIVMALGKLSDESARCYSKAIRILDNVAKVRSCLLMLDLECDQLIVDMFQQFLTTIRSKHPNAVFTQMEYIMTLSIEESEEISCELLYILLSSVKKENQNVSPLSYKLGEKVLKNCAVELQPFLPEVIRSMNLSIDNYSDVVISICQNSPGKEHEGAEEAGPSKSMEHGISQSRKDRTLRKINSEKTLERCHQVMQQGNTNSESLSPVQAEREATILRRRGRKSSFLLKPDEGNYYSSTGERKLLKGSHHRKSQGKIVDGSTSKQSALRQAEKETNSCIVPSKALHNGTASASATQHVRDTVGSQSRSHGKKTATSVDQDHVMNVLTVVKEELQQDHVNVNTLGYADNASAEIVEGKRNSNEEHQQGSQKNQVAVKTNMATTPAQSKTVVKKEDGSSEEYFEKDSRMTRDTKVYGEELVGCRIKVLWPLDDMFYEGAVNSFDPLGKKHQVLYADGDEEILDLNEEHWEFVEDISPNIEQHAHPPCPASNSHRPRKKKARTKLKSSGKNEETTSSSKRHRSFADKSRVEASKSGSSADAVRVTDETKVDPNVKCVEQKSINEANDSTPDILTSGYIAKDNTTSVAKHKSTSKEEAEMPRTISNPKPETTQIVELELESVSHNTGMEKHKSPLEELSEDMGKEKTLASVDEQESEINTIRKKRRLVKGEESITHFRPSCSPVNST